MKTAGGAQGQAVAPPAKRPKVLPPSVAAGQGGEAVPGEHFLSGVKVYVPTGGIPFVSTKARFWAAGVQRHGGSLTQDPKSPGITHVVVGDRGIASLPPQLQPGSSQPARSSSSPVGQPAPLPASKATATALAAEPQRHWVSSQWVEQCLAQQQLLPTEDFPPPDPDAVQVTPTAAGRPASRTSESLGSAAASRSSTAGLTGEALRRSQWLGPQLWHPACASMSLNELALQAVYSEERSRQIGNEPLVQALRELSKYERALNEDYFDDLQGDSKHLNHRSLRYSRAAAVVRACSYKLRPGLRAGDLPFVGDVTARQISEILERGSCRALDCFRADIAVADSRGRRRHDSVGAATRARFHSLPGVGQKTAKRWWDLGCRTFEDVELAAEPGGPLAPAGEGGAFPLSPEQRFSLGHWRDLLETTTVEEVQEMLGEVQQGLEVVSFPGWRVELVGGGRRSAASHDADVLVTHPTRPIEGVVGRLRDHLVSRGRLILQDEGMCRVQAGLLPTHLEKLKQEQEHVDSAAPSMQTMDKFDHLYAVYRTYAGKARRMDVILAPCEEFSFALVGWIGSRTYLRFMRAHAKDLGMFLNSHRLMRKIDGTSYIVPDERPPVDRSGQERWPPGWQPGRRVESERDVFELVGIRYRQPHERDAP